MRRVYGPSSDARGQQAGKLPQGLNILGALGMGGADGLGGADGQQIRTIITPEGHRIIITNGALGQAAQQQNNAQRSERSMETKEMLLKALIDDLSKNGRSSDMVPLQLGSR